MLRLASLVVTLAVLTLLISRAADPRMWTWFSEESTLSPYADSPHKDVAPAEPELVTPGPTDADQEEHEGAAEQFLALSDGTTELGREEMPAYWRLFGWAAHQSFAELQQRATDNPVLNQFMQRPEEQRGKLFRLELNVRRVLAYDAPANSAGIKKVYEVWGWTTESKAWLYVALTSHLPPGMPVGPDVYERATFAGYFLKVQGYHAAGAGPNDKPLAAPLLIGRISWKASAAPPRAAENQAWIWWLAGIAALFFAARLGLWHYGRQKKQLQHESPVAREIQQAKASNVRGWLAAAEGKAGVADDYTGNGDGNHARGYADFHDN